MEGGAFSYDAIQSPSAFRLLHLKTGQSSFSRLPFPIEITLFEASLENPPQYEALSYAWEGQEATEPIICNGKKLFVTRNVVNALLLLRVRRSQGVLWIDSICIDQSSTSDKNHQVPNMGAIYRLAQKVWIYLGSGSYQTYAAFDFLTDVVQTKSDYTRNWSDIDPTGVSLLYRFLRSRKNRFDDVMAKSRGIGDAADTHFISDILNQNWFNRTWPVQELVLASRPVLLCGNRTMTWATFVTALEVLRDYELYETSGLNPGMSGQLFDNTLCYRELKNLVNSTTSSSYDLKELNEHLALRTVLTKVRTKSAADPRDKVYALYGILEEAGICGLPEIDYNKSVQEVYMDITKAAIIFDESLEMLCDVSIGSLISGLPSWVPDWSNTAYSSCPTLSGKCAFATSTSSPYFTFEDSMLVVSGIRVDTIRQVAQSSSIAPTTWYSGACINLSDAKARRNSKQELVRTLQAWIHLAQHSDQHPTGDAPQDAFFSTIIYDKKQLSKLSRKEHTMLSEGFDAWLEVMSANLSPQSEYMEALREEASTGDQYEPTRSGFAQLFGCSEDLKDWPDETVILLVLRCRTIQGLPIMARIQDLASQNTYQKTFFTTDKGYFGIAPRLVEQGDRIVLISGVGVPLVVREAGGTADEFQLIGAAYIHGYMNGEKWPNDVDDLLEIFILI